jgi:hypothetical protein
MKEVLRKPPRFFLSIERDAVLRKDAERFMLPPNWPGVSGQGRSWRSPQFDGDLDYGFIVWSF